MTAYVVIAIILILVCVYFSRRRARRTNNYYPPLLARVTINDRQGRRGYRDSWPSPYYMQETPAPWPTVSNVPQSIQRDEFPYLYGKDPYVYDGPLPYDYDPYYDRRYPALHLRTVNPRAFISSEMWPEGIDSQGFNPVTTQPYGPTMAPWPATAFDHMHANGTPYMPISGLRSSFVTQPGSKVADLMQWISPVPCSDPDYHGELPCDRSNCTVGGGGPQYAGP